MLYKLLKACQAVVIFSGILVMSGCATSAAPTPAISPTASTLPSTTPTPTATATAIPTPPQALTPTAVTTPGGGVAAPPVTGIATPSGTAVAAPSATGSGAISIEIVGSEPSHTFIAPGQTATIPFDANPAVLVHYPYAVGSAGASGFRHYRTIVTVDQSGWKVEMGNYPNANTLFFHLRGNTPGRLTVTVAMPERNQTINFALVILPSTGATGTPSATSSVTLDDNGKTREFQVGQRFLLALGSGYDWTVNVVDSSVVSRVVNVLAVEGAQGIYEAKRPGRTTITAVGDPPCRKATPPCAAPSRLFKVDIVVK